MKIKFKHQARQNRHYKIRKTIFGTASRPRLAVFRSNRHFYAQIIDDVNSHTLVAFSSLNLSPKHLNADSSVVKKVAIEIFKLIKTAKITEIVFDRAGFLYHGQIAIFADTLRKQGLKF